MNMLQWNHRTTMAYHSCPGYSDVWRLFNNDFIFVMSSCRFFITPGRGQGAGSLAIPVSGLRRAAPQRPVAKQRWGMLSPCLAEHPSVLACKTNRRLPIGTGNRYIALTKRICWKPWWLVGYCLQRTSEVSAWYVPWLFQSVRILNVNFVT